jgi:hypothetical protein
MRGDTLEATLRENSLPIVSVIPNGPSSLHRTSRKVSGIASITD